MYDNASPRQESSGYESEPARIVLKNGETFDVAHYDRTESDRWVFAYVESRDGGIDYRFPASAVLYIDTSDGDGDEVERVDDMADAPVTMQVMGTGATPPTIEDDEDEDETLVADGGGPVGQLTLTGDEADHQLVKHRESLHVETSSIDRDDPVRYRETFTDPRTGEWTAVSQTYRVGHVAPVRDTVEIYAVGQDGEGDPEKVHIEDADIEDLSRCVKCETLMVYDDARCDECSRNGGGDR